MKKNSDSTKHEEANQNEQENLLNLQYLDMISEHKFLGLLAIKIQKFTSKIIKKRTIEIIKTLNSSKIEIMTLRKLCFEGIPDDLPSLRTIIWKIFFKFIPLNIDNWEEIIDDKRMKYSNIKDKIMVKFEFDRKEHSKDSTTNKDNYNKNKRVSIDHPLSTKIDSKWKSYFDDLLLIEEIEKDVKRTRSHMHFFSKSAIDEKISSLPYFEDFFKKEELSKAKCETNADKLTRILYIYAKLNPELRYIQGMNELLAPIYYCFSHDNNPYFQNNVEADSFICFEEIMSRIKDIFMRVKDNTEVGINAKLKRIMDIIRVIDKELYLHFQTEKIELQFFAFRWYTLLLTQEFELPDILRLWDSIFSVEDVFEFMSFLCISILKIKRADIISKDFSGIMLSLQNLESVSIDELINMAKKIRDQYINMT